MGDYIYVTLYVLGFVAFFWWFMRTRVRTGRIYVGQAVYDYKLGDKLEGEIDLSTGHVVNFKGIDITLEKKMPHIYLDSHYDSKFSGPRFHISRKNKVGLEGDFDTHFQLYAADGYKQLALSIIAPDVMAVLIDSSSRYDVEIKGLHLRLISQNNVYKNKKREAAILNAAHAVLEQVAHRQKSWKANEITDVDATQLKITVGQSVKIGRFMVPLWWFVCGFVGVIFTAIWLLSTAASFYPDGVQRISNSVRFMGAGVIIIFLFVAVSLLNAWRRRSPRSYRKFIGYFHS